MSEKEGKKILCLTDIKATNAVASTKEYVETLSHKLGMFNRIERDSNSDLISFAPPLITQTLSPFKKTVKIRTCLCGAYEELESVRMFGLRKVVNNKCVYCGTGLQQKEQEVLLSEIVWPTPADFTFNKTWSASDLDHFLKRQAKIHKISKENEVVRISHGDVEFGLRYQLVWSAMIVYLTELEKDTDVMLHYVHKIQDKAFFISSIAKMMRPSIHFHLKALPIVWLEESPLISDCSPSQVKLLTKSLNTKKKEIHVSLKSWHY